MRTSSTPADEAQKTLRREVSISAVSPGYWAEPDPGDTFLQHVRERPLVELQLVSRGDERGLGSRIRERFQGPGDDLEIPDRKGQLPRAAVFEE